MIMGGKLVLNNIYSKENLEGLVFDLIKYLYRTKDYNKKKLSEGVLIYSMNKLYYVSEEKHNFMLNNIPICIEENVKMEDYFEYCNNKTLALSMDCTLCEYLYYGDVIDAEMVQKKISKIFEKHGFYYDFGSSWYLYAKPINKANN